MPFLHLLYYHKADVTSQTFGRSRQNDVLHDAFQSIGHVSPKTGRPAPGGDPTSREIIKRRRDRLQPTIIEDGVYFWQCCPFFRDVRTESNTVTPRWKPLEDILKNGQSTKSSSSMRPRGASTIKDFSYEFQ
jgi:hypothetical protein